MFIPDGSNTDYAGDYRRFGYPLFNNIFAWGWLGATVPHNDNPITDEKIKTICDALRNICAKNKKVDLFCGFHLCEICLKNGQELKNCGCFSGSIKIDYNKKVYCCPAGVEHYIEDHEYIPPHEAIDAVLHGDILDDKKLLQLGESSPDVQKIKKELETRREQERKQYKEKYRQRVQQVQSQQFQEQINNAMIDNMRKNGAFINMEK